MSHRRWWTVAATAMLAVLSAHTPAVADGPAIAAGPPPAAAIDWEGLPTWSGGHGPLRNQTNGLKALRYQQRDYGINLDWTTWPNSRWEVYGEGLPANGSITSSTRVALKVDGSPGYVRSGYQSYGINLVWSSTPVYEWNLVTTSAGQALYNLTRGDWLVHGSRFYGVDLMWLSDKGTPTQPLSYRSVSVYNCKNSGRAVWMWTLDHQTQTWTDRGRLASSWNGTSCVYTGQPFTFTASGSRRGITLAAVDYTVPGCPNNPQYCLVDDYDFISDVSGIAYTYAMG
jgi:hypothetical protein